MEKSMSEEKLQNHNKQIEEFTGNKTTEVNIVPKILVLENDLST